MGLGEAPPQRKLEDVYPLGTPFRITNAWVEGPVKTQYGDSMVGQLVVEPIDGGQAEQFGVWGSRQKQISNLAPGDVPGVYLLVQEGQSVQFRPAAAGTGEVAAADTLSTDAETAAAAAAATEGGAAKV